MQEPAQPILAGCLGLGEPGWKRVRLDARSGLLHEAEFGDIPADRGLGGPKATLAQRRCQLLLGSNGAPVHEVADRSMSKLLHDFHGGARYRSQSPSQATTTRPASPSR